MGRSTEDVIDDWLVLGAQGGDAAAFEILAQRWHRRLLAHAYRRLEHADGATEATQEAWLAIVRGLARLDDPSRFPAWAYRIVDRKAVDWLRRRRRQSSIDERIKNDPERRSDAIDPGPDVRSTEDAEHLAAVDRLRQLLRELPGEVRMPLALYYADGRSVREIAEVLGIPEGTVKSRLFHARQLLKHRLGDRS